MQFQNAQYSPKNPGKFEKLLGFEKAFTTNPDCKPKELAGGCKALADYQGEKTMDVVKSLTIVYNAKDPDEAIQTQKYLDWIKTNYGTTLTFDQSKGAKNGSGTD